MQYQITKVYHSKIKQDIWIVSLSDRVDRERFNTLKGAAIAIGGWYSKAYRASPAGFAFKAAETAQQWAIDNLGDTGSSPGAVIIDDMASDQRLPEKYSAEAKKLDRQHTANALKRLAENMQSQIDDKMTDRLENTPKRQLEGAKRRIDADHLTRTQKALRGLAEMYEKDTVPPVLAGITTKSKIHLMTRTKTESSGYYDLRDTGERADTSPQAEALWQIIGGVDADRLNQAKLKAKINALQFAKIPGYFPTPPELVERMIEAAEIEPGMLTLEPSAGSGAILDALTTTGATVNSVERHASLCEILSLKGHRATQGDFLNILPSAHYDRVIMNPPFEKRQDIEHVRHAFQFLKPGGRLVAIMSPGPFFGNVCAAIDFRKWFGELGGSVEEIPAGAFKASGTGIASRLVIIDKPAETAQTAPEKQAEKPEALASLADMAARLTQRSTQNDLFQEA